MKEKHYSSIPDPSLEDLPAELLAKFEPIPGARFYDRMDKAPWTPRGKQAHLRRSFLISFVSLLLVFGGVLVSPSGRVLSNRITQFFQPAQSTTLSLLTSTPSGDEPSGSSGLLVREFSLLKSEAQAKVEFPLKEPSWLPEEALFDGAYHDPQLNTVIFRYKDNNQSLFFSQRELGGINEVTSVAPGIPVEKVLIHSDEGELVRGGWQFTKTPQPFQTPVPNATLVVDLFWDPELPQTVLRWQTEEKAFELMLVGEGRLDDQTLIQIARSIE
jgi:hypothetical protein